MQPGSHLSARVALVAGGTWYARNRSLQPRSDSSASYPRCLTHAWNMHEGLPVHYASAMAKRQLCIVQKLYRKSVRGCA